MQVPTDLAGENGIVARSGSSLKVDVDLVLLNVAVAGSRGDMPRLSAEHFRVFEDKVEQRIACFQYEEAPASIGILLDVSGSMSVGIVVAEKAVSTFLKTSNPLNEYFLITFSDSPALELDFTPFSSDVAKSIALRIVGGSTSLYDAIHVALEKMMRAHHQRKVIILVTDGRDNNSQYTFDNICDTLKKSRVEVYSVGILGTLDSQQDDGALLALTEIARISGGKTYVLRFDNKLEEVCARIALEIKGQYLVGYYSSGRHSKKSWRSIKVKLKPPRGSPPLSARCKSGYYASGF